MDNYEAVPLTDPASRTRIIGVSSGKGGVGKSSTTVNLAAAWAQRGKSVAVIDADVYGFSVPKMLGITAAPGLVDDKIIPPSAYGVKVISMGSFADDDQPIVWRGPMLHKALQQFVTDVTWGPLDVVLIDLPPGTGDVAISMAQLLPRSETVVVTTPQPAAQRVAQRSALMARKVRLAVVGVIENMSWFTGNDGTRYELFGAGGGAKLADSLEVPLLGQIPFVPAVREGADDGVPAVAADPESEVARAYAAVIDALEAIAPRRRYRSELSISADG